LGGYVLLPRLLDKGRASLAGRNGDYNYGCPLDQHFFRFTGVDPDALKAEIALAKGDGQILEWIQKNAPHPHAPWQILQWSEYQLRRGPDSDADTLNYFANAVGRLSTAREDVRTWFDLLDLDDHVSYGGKA